MFHGWKLPGPSDNLKTWMVVFEDKCKWHQLIQLVYFTDSINDKFKNSNPSGNIHTESTCTHVCMQCPASSDGTRPCWSTAKALASHMRSKHNVLSEFRYFVNSDGICPVCKTCYNSRIRCLAHLSDRRRPKCANILLEGHTRKLSEVTVLKLDEYDREQRRLAQRQGHSHPIAQTPATTCTGKVVGRVVG